MTGGRIIQLTAKAENVNMFQFSTRDVGEDEPLSMMTIYGINIWMDKDNIPVIVDLPNDFVKMNYVR